MSYRLGVDVGGTFTDFLLFDEAKQQMILLKVSTTPANQAMGIMNGIEKITRQAGIAPAQMDFFLHGTTAATNALLEGKGARTALIVTEGFRDVLHIMRQDRPKLYDFFARRPEALIPRHLRFEVGERLLHTGEVQKALDEQNLAEILAKIAALGIEAVAVCLLHSYVNPVHEQRIAAALRAECPGIAVSISSEILPEIKEYERMSTTAINACVVPIVDRYLRDLEGRLARLGISKTVHIMQSNGGILPAPQAGQRSAAMVLSGPAAGVLGGVALAKQAGFRNVITVDMGGTSFDVCLAHQGKPRFSRAGEMGGHALSIPMIDIHTIGAGGGSIAWMDSGGALKVGPQSAGADPGPVCYDQGGRDPTVTDANLILGRLNPAYFLGGAMRINEKAARRSLEERLARPLGMDVLEVAEGIIRVVNAKMARGIRFVSVEKGYDPREFALVCFGGNGPLHGAELAKELAIPQVLVPFAPGVNCAYGLLMADFRHDYVRTYVKKLAEVRPEEISRLYQDLECTARAQMQAAGISGRWVVHASLDIRYCGQGYELEVPLDRTRTRGRESGARLGRITRPTLQAAEKRFHSLHQRAYGFAKPNEPAEIVNLRMTCLGLLPKPELPQERLGKPDPRGARKDTRLVLLR